MAIPFVLITLGAALITEGELFELLARPGDHQADRLFGLMSFGLAGTGLGIVTASFGMPTSVFVASMLIVGYGHFTSQVVRAWYSAEIVGITAFGIGGILGAIGGQVIIIYYTNTITFNEVATITFIAISGTFLASLLRAIFLERDDPLILLVVGLLLWLLAELPIVVSWTQLSIALLIIVPLGYIAFFLETASIQGMVTGILLGFLTIILGGYSWFALLIAFFGIGGLSTKYRYEEKLERGVAEPQGGARGTGNVLGNSLTALIAVLLFAAHEPLNVSPDLFMFAFAGSLATALSDTLSSEIGGLYDNPHLITTFESVDPGTDGAVTIQGEIGGIAGSLVIALLALLLFDLQLIEGGYILLAGIIGMTTDSLFGALLEGEYLGNQSVNFLATVVGALMCAGMVFYL